MTTSQLDFHALENNFIVLNLIFIHTIYVLEKAFGEMWLRK